jgi:hypothetical protein
VLTTAAATLLPAAAACAATKEIKGYAHVSNNTGQADSKEGKLSLNTIGSIGDIAGAIFAGTAQYQLYTTHGNGASQVSGTSSPVAYSTYLSNGKTTQADGYAQISDYFTVLGFTPDRPSAEFRIRTTAFGLLMPNNSFESEWNAGHPNAHIETASVTMHLDFFETDGQGNRLGEIFSRDSSYGSGQPSDDFVMAFGQSGVSTPGHRSFGFQLTIGGFGQQGGGFALAGSGGTGSIGLASDGSAHIIPASDADTFFQIHVELPPGLSISGQSALVTAVTVPEPSLALAALAALMTSTRLRRRGR